MFIFNETRSLRDYNTNAIIIILTSWLMHICYNIVIIVRNGEKIEHGRATKADYDN